MVTRLFFVALKNLAIHVVVSVVLRKLVLVTLGWRPLDGAAMALCVASPALLILPRNNTHEQVPKLMYTFRNYHIIPNIPHPLWVVYPPIGNRISLSDHQFDCASLNSYA